MSVLNNSEVLLLAADVPTGYNIERSLRFNSADSAYLSRTPASAGNRKTWTWAGWVKRSALGAYQPLFICADSGSLSNRDGLRIENDDSLHLFASNTTYSLKTSQVFRDTSAWYHIVCAVDTDQAVSSNRYKLYVNGTQITAFSVTAYPTLAYAGAVNTAVAHYIGLHGNYANLYLSGYLADIHFIDGQALTPTSFGEFDANGVWQPKAFSGGSYGTNGFQLKFADNSNNTATTLGKDTSGNNNNWMPTNLQVTTYTLPAYSATNTTTAASAFDGNLATFWQASTGTSTLTFTQPVTGSTFRLYMIPSYATGFLINGTAPAVPQTSVASWYDFSSHINGSLSSISITYGGGTRVSAIEVNGFILRPIGTSQIDSFVDSPTSYGTDTGVGAEVRGNYCTWNPLLKGQTGTPVYSNGNLDASATGNWAAVGGTVGIESGKWYWETTLTAAGSSNQSCIGLLKTVPTFFLGFDSGSWGYFSNGNKYTGGTASAYGSSYTANDVIGVAFDRDNGTLVFYKNGVSQGTAFTGLTSGVYFPATSHVDSSTSATNFGQRPFAYTAPSGFKALCTANLPTPTIANPATAMDVVTYTGNGASRTISMPNSANSPDLVWIKSRANGAYWHMWADAVRGANNHLSSNRTDAEITDATGIGFTSGGFTLGADTVDSYYGWNINNDTYVAWTWDAGSSTVTNTSGSISSQVRASVSSGFSMVSYTGNGVNGATVGHGLNVTPSMIIVKSRAAGTIYPSGPYTSPVGNTSDWFVFHASLGASSVIKLNSTAAAGTLLSLGGVGGCNSTTFTCTQASNQSSYGTTYLTQVINTASTPYVAYCFAPVAGYSSFGSYTGNGSADGPFVFLGFRPAVVIVKMSSSTGNWTILDDKREGYNVDNDPLYPNLADAEGTTDLIDITSNGFKVRTTDATFNTNAGTYVYAAWASSPFAYARAR